MRRAQAEAIDGVLLLDKPRGMSANHALQQARRLLNARKAGHTGTLDPLASGLLPLTLGEATKFSADLLEADKEYEAQIGLGTQTQTGDAEGAITQVLPVAVTREHFVQVLGGLVGRSQQVPPMHSALKRDGRPLYELARRGITVERAPRTIEISRLALVQWDAQRPLVQVACSKGTYIRVLAEQIGTMLGCGAHLHGLRRTRVGGLQLAQAISLAELEALEPGARRARLLPVDALLTDLPVVQLDAASARRFLQGQRQAGTAVAERVRVYDAGGALLGVARCAAGWIEPVRLVAQAPDASAHAAAPEMGIEEVT